jgi:hypothetical protein
MKHYKRWLRNGDPTKRIRGKAKGQPCSVDDCTGEAHARDLCLRHWKRWRKYGDPNGGYFRRYGTAEEAFIARSNPTDSGCIEWTGSTDRHGYGELSVDGKRTGAHRYAWERKHGKANDQLMIDHMCHNPLCVNVDHLRLVTRSENQQNRKGATKLSTTGVRNVYWDPRESKYYVRIRSDGKDYYGSYHDNADDAEAEAIEIRSRVHIVNPMTA